MMTASSDVWGSEARDAVARAIAERMPNYDNGYTAEDYYPEADAVLAALAAAGKTIVDDPGWEWGTRSARTGMVNRMPDEESARRYAIGWGEAVRRPATVPPGPWEVAP